MGIILIVSIALNNLTVWFSKNFTIGIQEILFTIKSPLQGADTDFLKDAISFVNIKSLFAILITYILVILFFEYVFSKITACIIIKFNKSCLKINIYSISLAFLACVILLSALSSIKFADKTTNFSEYLRLEKTQTNIFEENYVKPTSDIIHGKGKNLKVRKF